MKILEIHQKTNFKNRNKIKSDNTESPFNFLTFFHSSKYIREKNAIARLLRVSWKKCCLCKNIEN